MACIIGRNGVQTGDTVVLRALMVDEVGCPRDTDALPQVYIYDPDVDGATIEAEVEAGTFTSATAGPLSPTKITTGFYELSYVVPQDGTPGVWHDVWISDLDNLEVYNVLSFTVEEGGDFESQALRNNELIIIELDSSITNIAGSGETALELNSGLGTELSFLTVLSPFCASVEMLRMFAGPLLNYLPDDTLALMIHWASIEAQAISPPKRCPNYDFAKTQFVLYAAALFAMLLPGGGAYSDATGSRGSTKTLGEFSVKDGSGSSSSNTLSGGVDKETIEYFRKARDEWWRVVNTGGCINPGEGLGPAMGIRGVFDPARGQAGRLWEKPADHHFSHPTTNVKRQWKGTRYNRFGFSGWRGRTGSLRGSKPQYSRRYDGYGY